MKLGFVGFGSQAKENILPACSAIFGVEVAAICDTDEARLREAREGFPRAEIFRDYREMLDSVALDAVVAACYPTDHYHIATDALMRGIPVFIEKPLAPSSGHVDRLVDLAEQQGCSTGVGMNFRFAEVTRRLASVAEGEINAITLRQHANKPVTPYWDYSSVLRSFLHAQTIHGLDFLIHLCGPVRDLRVADSGLAAVARLSRARERARRLAPGLRLADLPARPGHAREMERSAGDAAAAGRPPDGGDQPDRGRPLDGHGGRLARPVPRGDGGELPRLPARSPGRTFTT